MRRAAQVCLGGLLLALSACSEPVGDADACAQFREVRDEVTAYAPGSAVSAAEEERHRQWEFRLAAASVKATDIELSASLRRLADVTAAVTYGGEAEMERFVDLAEQIDAMCR